jgi:hypothetical protein
MVDDPLDVIAAAREDLRAAFQKATTDQEKLRIQGQINDLADLQEKTILDQFQNEAEKIKALSDTLNGIIQKLRGHIDSFFLDDLKKIVQRNGLLPPKAGKAGKG